MSKLDPHADLIKQLYAETGTVKGTHAIFQKQVEDVSYECLRQWLLRNQAGLPTLRTGPGKPKSAREKQLFGILDENAKWMPSAGMHPEWFLMFHRDCTPELKDGYLATALTKFGVETTLNALETTNLPLTRMRNLCDLEYYLLAYLLGRHSPLIGASEEEFSALTRAVTPMAVALKEIALRRNSIRVGELRDLLLTAEANCRKDVEQRRK